jgi:diguanylate cyclase (GGDEF)-like protein
MRIKRNVRGGATFRFALLDLDHFKRVNDSRGHGAGDEILCAFARQAEGLLRANDVLGRWGGDEFLLLMPAVGARDACNCVERMRIAVEQMALPASVSGLQLTLSAGVVEHRTDESVARMVDRADVALYRAKAQGRNQIAVG